MCFWVESLTIKLLNTMNPTQFYIEKKNILRNIENYDKQRNS